MPYNLKSGHFKGTLCRFHFESPSPVLLEVLQKIIEVQHFPRKEMHFLRAEMQHLENDFNLLSASSCHIVQLSDKVSFDCRIHIQILIEIERG